jgi:hypothetical protein
LWRLARVRAISPHAAVALDEPAHIAYNVGTAPSGQPSLIVVLTGRRSLVQAPLKGHTRKTLRRARPPHMIAIAFLAHIRDCRIVAPLAQIARWRISNR